MAFLRYPKFPRLPGMTGEQQRVLEEWAGALIGELELRDQQANFGPANKDPYQLTTVSIQRTYDVSSATTATTAAVLGTLLYDLTTAGRLS